MTIELKLNPDLLKIIETLADKECVSVPQWIQDNLEKSAHEIQKEIVYRMYLDDEL